jgi:hypothetical protein
MGRGRNTLTSTDSLCCCVVLGKGRERYPGASPGMRSSADPMAQPHRTCFSRCVYERRIRELRITNSLNRVKLHWRLGFRDVPFGLSFLFPYRPSFNTGRTKILDRTPYRDCQQLHRLCNWIQNFTAWLYSRKPVLHLRICVQYAVVAQGTNAHKSSLGLATGIMVRSLTAPG